MTHGRHVHERAPWTDPRLAGYIIIHCISNHTISDTTLSATFQGKPHLASSIPIFRFPLFLTSDLIPHLGFNFI